MEYFFSTQFLYSVQVGGSDFILLLPKLWSNIDSGRQPNCPLKLKLSIFEFKIGLFPTVTGMTYQPSSTQVISIYMVQGHSIDNQ